MPERSSTPRFKELRVEASDQILIQSIDDPRGEQRTQSTMSTHLRRENEISDRAGHFKNELLLHRLRRNDPALTELILNGTYIIRRVGHSPSHSILRIFLPAFDAIATNTSLEILNIEGPIIYFIMRDADSNDRVKRALSHNSSLKDIRIATPSWLRDALGIIMASPNMEALTIRCSVFTTERPRFEDITAMAQVLRINTNLHSLTIQGFRMDSDCGAAIAAAFQENQTIKTLILSRSAFSRVGSLSFVEALPHDHSLEAIVFDEGAFDDIDENGFVDDSAVSIVRTLCHTPLKVLSLGGNDIRQDSCEKIVQALRENEHSFTKLDLFRDSQHSPWQNEIRLQIDLLTRENRLQVEKDTWVAQFLHQDAHTQELLFCAALERANKVDNKQFSKVPNMLFYLIKELPDLIAQAIRDEALNVNCHGTRQLVCLCCCLFGGKEL